MAEGSALLRNTRVRTYPMPGGGHREIGLAMAPRQRPRGGVRAARGVPAGGACPRMKCIRQGRPLLAASTPTTGAEAASFALYDIRGLRRRVDRGRSPGRARVERGLWLADFEILAVFTSRSVSGENLPMRGSSAAPRTRACGPMDPVSISIGERPVQSKRAYALVTSFDHAAAPVGTEQSVDDHLLEIDHAHCRHHRAGERVDRRARARHRRRRRHSACAEGRTSRDTSSPTDRSARSRSMTDAW